MRCTGVGVTMIEAELDILTLEEVANYLRVTKRTLYKLAQEGTLPAFKLGGTWRFRRDELNQWITENIGKQRSGYS